MRRKLQILRKSRAKEVWVGEVGCVCVVWCCCCKSMPSYFLIPSIAVLFFTGTRHHQPRPCSAVYLPDQQHRQNNSRRNKRGHDSSQQTSTPPSAARRVPSVFAGSWLHPRPGWIALLRCRSPVQLLSDNELRFLSMNDGKLRRKQSNF